MPRPCSSARWRPGVCQAGGVDAADLGAAAALPDPALVVLVGPSGSGKSVWAAQRYRPDEVVSSDRLRALVGSGEHDLDAPTDAFALLDLIVAARLRRGLTAVVDTLGLDPARHRGYLGLARSSGMPAVAVLLDIEQVGPPQRAIDGGELGRRLAASVRVDRQLPDLDPGPVLHGSVVKVDLEPVPDGDGRARKSQDMLHGAPVVCSWTVRPVCQTGRDCLVND